MKTKQLKIFIIVALCIFSLFLGNKVFASNLILKPSKDNLGLGEQFYVDLMLDTQGESMNAIKGSILFPSDNVTFLRAENGKSMINLWIEEPKENNNIISFAGALSNGFDGVIDPFNPNTKLPGLMTRLVFETKASGKVYFLTSDFSLNLNDGLGTEIGLLNTELAANIGDFINRIRYESNSPETPTLEAYVIRDQNIFNNKYALIFKAGDKGTGIKNVKIKEGRNDWINIESPYLLKDQSRHSNITLQATNFSGASIIMSINGIPYDWAYIIKLLILIIVIIISSVVIIKIRYVHKK